MMMPKMMMPEAPAQRSRAKLSDPRVRYGMAFAALGVFGGLVIALFILGHVF